MSRQLHSSVRRASICRQIAVSIVREERSAALAVLLWLEWLTKIGLCAMTTRKMPTNDVAGDGDTFKEAASCEEELKSPRPSSVPACLSDSTLCPIHSSPMAAAVVAKCQWHSKHFFSKTFTYISEVKTKMG